MDYLGWELERQRSALAALLLGGGESEEEAVRNGQRRSPAGSETAGRAVAESAGRYAGASGEAGGFDITTLEVGEAVRRTGRLPERTERAANAQDGGESPEQRVPKAGAGTSDVLRRTGPEEDSFPLGGGTGAQGIKFSDEDGGQWEEQETAVGKLAETSRTAEGKIRAGEQTAGSRGGAVPPVTELLERADAEGGGDLWRSRDAQAGSPAGTERLLRRNGTAFAADGSGAMTTGSYGLPVARPFWGGGEAADLRVDTDARTLSRAVQRDARRYDGGFILY